MMKSCEDLEILLQSASRSDPRVTEALVRQYAALLQRLAYSILGDRDETEDAVQEILINALRRLDQYRPGTSLRNWLYTIAVNHCRDILRERRRRQALHKALNFVGLSITQDPAPEEVAVQNERYRDVWEAVKALNEKHRLPVLLHFAHGLSLKETAQVLGIREGTVASRLHYAVVELRVRLGKKMDKELKECGNGLAEDGEKR